jgi:hypothetical protein
MQEIVDEDVPAALKGGRYTTKRLVWRSVM